MNREELRIKIREILIKGFGGHDLPIGNINLAESKLVILFEDQLKKGGK